MAASRRFPFSVPASVLVLVLLVVAGGAEARGFPGPDFRSSGFRVLMEEIQLADGSLADVYAPAIPRGLKRKFEDAFPVGVLLQGALVDKAFYSDYARTVAEDGYVVVVPNRERTVAPGFIALFADVHVVTDALDAIIVEDSDRHSPLYRITDPTTSFLIGHSFGGAVAIDAADAGDPDPLPCVPPFCDPSRGPFVRPAGLKAAVIYGGSQVTCETDDDGNIIACTPLSRNTSGVGILLIQGVNDGVAEPIKADANLPEFEPPHGLVQIPGANHFAICDVNAPPGAIPDPNPSELDQEAAVALVAEETLDWVEMILATD